MIKQIADKIFNIDGNIGPGFYAIEDPDDNVLKFFKVDIPKKGKWKNKPFLSIQASEEFHTIKNHEYRKRIMDEIKKSPIEAQMRYGQEIECCGMCGLTLTNEESRRRGIGPICWEKL